MLTALNNLVPTKPSGDQRVRIHHISWAGYCQVLAGLGNNRKTRLIFDQGTLEITMPSEQHEQAQIYISLFIRIWVLMSELKLKTIGSTTLNRFDLQRGAEPDNAFYIQNQAKVAGKYIDLAVDPPPDLVVEVDITHTDIDKNSFYASLGVPEFWRFNGEKLVIYQRQEAAYQAVDQSPTFPLMQKEDFYQFLDRCQQDEIAAELSLRQLIQSRREGA